jgi:Glycosyltransferase family 87
MVGSRIVHGQAPSRSGAAALAASAASVVLFATYAAAPDSPFQPVLPAGAGAFGPFRRLAVAGGLDRLAGPWLVGAGVLVTVTAVAAFLLLLRESWRGHVSARSVLLLAVGANLIVLLLPLLFSRDVYSYAFYGRIAGVYHANPYVHTPVEFATDRLWSFVGPKWVDTPAVYGPAWTQASSLIAGRVGSVAGMVQTFRVIAVAASLGTIALIADGVRRVWPARTAFAVAAFGLNPVVVFHSVASGHNDLLVALAVAGSLAFLIRGRQLPAVAVLTLGVLVKAPALVALLLVLVWCIARAPRERRWRTALTHVGLAAILGLVFAAPFLQGRDPTLGMLELAGHEGWLAPSPSVRKLVDAISFGTLGWTVRVAFALVLLVALAALARDVARRASERSPRELGAALGWALILLMLLGPVLLPWYVTWALPLVWVLPRAPRAALITTGAGLALAQWSTEPLRYPGAFRVNLWVGHWIVVPVVTGLLVWTLVDLRYRLTHGLTLEDQESVAEQSAQP